MDQVMWIGLSTVFATLLGPILAVQAQKFLEGRRSLKDQKMRIFTILMATRAARLSQDHVQALNMIDLAFAGGARTRRRSETEVLEAWRDYLDHLTSQVGPQNFERWNEKQRDGLITLLSTMAADLGLRYDKVLLRNGAYIPKGHTDVESEQNQLRQLAIQVMSGEQPLSMKVTDFPYDPDLAQTQLDLQKGIADVLTGEQSIRVRVAPDGEMQRPGDPQSLPNSHGNS